MDVPTLIASFVGVLTTLGAGLGWLRSHELRRIGEAQAAANVEVTRLQSAAEIVRLEASSFDLYRDAVAALQVANKATEEANHFSNEIRAECARLREAQAVMRGQLEECIAARALGSANVARLTQTQVEAKAEAVALRAELVELRRQLQLGSPAAAVMQEHAAEVQLEAATKQNEAADKQAGGA